MTALETAAIDYVRLRRHVEGLRFSQQRARDSELVMAWKRLERAADMLMSVYTETETQ